MIAGVVWNVRVLVVVFLLRELVSDCRSNVAGLVAQKRGDFAAQRRAQRSDFVATDMLDGRG
jgi:hypothetical protein